MNLRILATALVTAASVLVLAACGDPAGYQSSDTGAGTVETFQAAGILCQANHGGSDGGIGISCSWTSPADTSVPNKPSFADIETFAQGGYLCVAAHTSEGNVGTSCRFDQPGAQGQSTKPSFANVAVVTRNDLPCITIASGQDADIDCGTQAATAASAQPNSSSSAQPEGGYYKPTWRPRTRPTVTVNDSP